MERLTIEYDGQFMPKEMCTIDRFGEADDCEACGGICEEFIETGCTECPIQKAFNRLAEYEELGLTPEQLKEIDKLYTEKCKQISDMSRYIAEKLDDAKPPYNRILDSLEENKMQVGQISGLNKAIKIVRECMENMDQVEYRNVCEPEYLGENSGIGKSYEIDYDHYEHCPECGQAIDWRGLENL